MAADLHDQDAQHPDLVIEPRFEPVDLEALRRQQAAALDRLLEQWARNFLLDCANNFLVRRGES